MIPTLPLRRLAGGLLLLLAALPLAAEERWLAVGYGGRRMVSTDGLKWEITAEWAQPGGDDGNNLMSAVFAQGKFVVAGGGGGGPTGAGHVLVSPDGREWKETYSSKSRVNPVVFGGGRFVAGTSSYPSGKLIWSADAETWQEGAKIAKPGLTHFRHGAYGNGVFILVGNGSRKNDAGEQEGFHWAIVSPDGEKITSERTDLPAHGQLHFGNGRFVMLSHEGVLQTTADGIQWKRIDLGVPEKPAWLAFDGTKFLIGDYRRGWQSADGLEWKDSGIRSGPEVKWTDGRRFIATGWPGKMSYSADGKIWQKASPLTDNGINVVVRGE